MLHNCKENTIMSHYVTIQYTLTYSWTDVRVAPCVPHPNCLQTTAASSLPKFLSQAVPQSPLLAMYDSNLPWQSLEPLPSRLEETLRSRTASSYTLGEGICTTKKSMHILYHYFCQQFTCKLPIYLTGVLATTGYGNTGSNNCTSRASRTPLHTAFTCGLIAITIAIKWEKEAVTPIWSW